MNQWRAQGPFVVQAGLGEQPNYPVPTIKDDSYGFAKGATGIARSLPTNPAAQLSTALGELTKDGLPKMIGSNAFKNQVKTAHKAGDEYLNYEFGWLPLVSDLKKFAHAVKHRHEIMHGYLKYSDKQIRRRYNFPASADYEAETYNSAYINADFEYRLGCINHVSSSVREWFSGSFRYHVPTPTDFGSKAAYYQAEASKILGLELTPEVVWNLAPWSWAVDWFTNTGDVIHNISRLGKDGLVMRYGYQMYQMKTSRQFNAYQNSASTPGFESNYFREEAVKIRWRASPYGFGVSYNGLSDSQKAVIVALGLTRAF